MLDAKKLISEQSARIVEQDTRIQKLEEMFKKGGCDFEFEEKGSCSVKLPTTSEDKIKPEKSKILNDEDMQVLSKTEFLQVYMYLIVDT